MTKQIDGGTERVSLTFVRAEIVWVARLNALVEIRRLMRSNSLTVGDLEQAFKKTRLAQSRSTAALPVEAKGDDCLCCHLRVLAAATAELETVGRAQYSQASDKG